LCSWHGVETKVVPDRNQRIIAKNTCLVCERGVEIGFDTFLLGLPKHFFKVIVKAQVLKGLYSTSRQECSSVCVVMSTMLAWSCLAFFVVVTVLGRAAYAANGWNGKLLIDMASCIPSLFHGVVVWSLAGEWVAQEFFNF
jgi:hypothetical protein